jgi:hypothetical protein
MMEVMGPLTPGEDAVDRARLNGTLSLLAWDIQKAYWQADVPLDDATAHRIATEKIAGRVKLPPKLKPDHVRVCPRCGRAHILPLTPDEWLGQQDAVERLCHLAQAAVNRDNTAERGYRGHHAILSEIADELRDQVARQTAETAMTARKFDWALQRGAFTHRDRATERQQEAAYLVHVLGLSTPAAAQRMKVSKQRVQALLTDYLKNTQ